MHLFMGVVLEDAKHGERCNPLPVGRKFMEGQSPVVDREGLNPLARMVRKIAVRHGCLVPGCILHDRIRQFPSIEGLPARRCDLLQGPGMQGKAHPAPGRRGVVAGEEYLAKGRHVPPSPRGCRPVPCRHGGDMESIAGIGDCPLQERGEREAAEPAMQFHPATDGSGNGHRIPARLGDCSPAAHRRDIETCR